MRDLLVYSKSATGEKQSSILGEFVLKDYNVWIDDVIDAKLAKEIIVLVSYLSKQDPSRAIRLIINSPGGEISAGFAIYDFLKMIPNPIYTYGMGLCASMASILLICCGEKGKRFASKHCEIMIHQPLVQSMGGQASDVKIVAEKLIKTKDCVNTLLASNCNLTKAVIEELSDRDCYINIEQAMEYGMIDKVIDYEIWQGVC